MNTKNLLITGMFAGLFLSCKEVEPPAPVLPVPTPEQIKWQKLSLIHISEPTRRS